MQMKLKYNCIDNWIFSRQNKEKQYGNAARADRTAGASDGGVDLQPQPVWADVGVKLLAEVYAVHVGARPREPAVVLLPNDRSHESWRWVWYVTDINLVSQSADTDDVLRR